MNVFPYSPILGFIAINTNPSDGKSFPVYPFQLKNSQKICCICRGEINAKKQGISCPGCGTLFHLTHFAEWIRTNGQCPICQKEILMKDSQTKSKQNYNKHLEGIILARLDKGRQGRFLTR
ncbi:MAG: RING finger domain-containing protein [Candidatus Hodarchaeales archaeon]|jgi:hypothetical protein